MPFIYIGDYTINYYILIYIIYYIKLLMFSHSHSNHYQHTWFTTSICLCILHFWIIISTSSTQHCTTIVCYYCISLYYYITRHLFLLNASVFVVVTLDLPLFVFIKCITKDIFIIILGIKFWILHTCFDQLVHWSWPLLRLKYNYNHLIHYKY